MLERNNRFAGRRSDDEMLRRMLFGNGSVGRVPSAVDGPSCPVMESMKPAPENTGVDCTGSETAGGNRPLAMVYSPEQKWQNLLNPESALYHGSIFRDLVKPFEGRTIRGRN